MRGHGLRACRVAPLVVVPREEGPAVRFPEIHLNARYAWRNLPRRVLCRHPGDDVEPSDDAQRPSFSRMWSDPVPKDSFTADVHLARVEEAAEEFPARRHFVALETLFFGDQVDGARRGHGAREAMDAMGCEVRD